jgi:hypothetical protein
MAHRAEPPRRARSDGHVVEHRAPAPLRGGDTLGKLRRRPTLGEAMEARNGPHVTPIRPEPARRHGGGSSTWIRWPTLVTVTETCTLPFESSTSANDVPVYSFPDFDTV